MTARGGTVSRPESSCGPSPARTCPRPASKVGGGHLRAVARCSGLPQRRTIDTSLNEEGVDHVAQPRGVHPRRSGAAHDAGCPGIPRPAAKDEGSPTHPAPPQPPLHPGRLTVVADRQTALHEGDTSSVGIIRQDGGHGRRPSGADLRARNGARRAGLGAGTRTRCRVHRRVRAVGRRRRHRQDPRRHRARLDGQRLRPPRSRRPLSRPRRQCHAVPAVRRGAGRTRAQRARRGPDAVAGARRSARIRRSRRWNGARRHPLGGCPVARHPRRSPASDARRRGRALGRRVHPSPAAVPARPAVHQPGLARRQLPQRRSPPPAPAPGGRRGVVAAPGSPTDRARPPRRQRRGGDPAFT